MAKWRDTARHRDDIKRDIDLLKAHAGLGIGHIHLIPCDFEKVARNPEEYNVAKQSDGRIVTVVNKKLIEIVSIE